MPRPVRLLTAVLLLSVYIAFPNRVSGSATSAFLPGFPLLKQQHSLTCEASAVSMGTRALITETQLMRAIPRNPNPNIGFRGDPSGEQGTTLVNYGVYAAPLHRALLRYGYGSDVLTYATDETLRTYIDRGWPVVTWITYNLKHEVPRLEWSNGTQFFLVPWEHAVLMVGYDASTVIVQDPWIRARRRYSWVEFNRAWGYFARMALAVEPCALPGAVSQIRPTFGTDSSLTWTWQPGKNDVSFHVRVIRHGTTDRVMFDGLIPDHRYSLTKSNPGASYEIDITAMTACGGLSTPSVLWTYIAPPPSTPTPTPVEATVSATPSTPVATSLPNPSVTPTQR